MNFPLFFQIKNGNNSTKNAKESKIDYANVEMQKSIIAIYSNVDTKMAGNSNNFEFKYTYCKNYKQIIVVCACLFGDTFE